MTNGRLGNAATHLAAPDRRVHYVQQAAGFGAALFLVALLIRIFLPYEVVDLVWLYSSPGGSFIQKIHPGAYALFVTCAAIYVANSIRNNAFDLSIEKSSRIFIFSIMCVILLAIITDHVQGISFILDSVLLAPIVAMAMVRLDDRTRYRVFISLVYFMVANDFITFFEFSTHDRLFPYAGAVEEAMYTFRPAALLGHPLINGMCNAVTIPLVWLLPYSIGRRAAVVLFFLAADFASGARMASLFGVGAAVASTWLFLAHSVRQKRIDESVMVVFALATIGVAIISVILIAALGLADRFFANGLAFNDASAQSRFTAFRILSYLSNRELMFGLSREWARYIMLNQLRIEAIENPFLSFVVQFGLVGTLILVPCLLYFLRNLAGRKGRGYIALSVLAFVAIESTSLSIAAKGPMIAFITAICLGAHAANSGLMTPMITARRGDRARRPLTENKPHGAAGTS